PIENGPYSDVEKEEFRRNPQAMLEVRAKAERAFTDGFANVLVDAQSPIIQAIHANCEANLDDSVRDPELRERLRPEYQAACKRLVMSADFYDAIQKPNAKLVTSEIERVEKAGVRTRDGALHELDALVLATGFRVDTFVRPMEVIGRDGVHLDTLWKGGPTAHLAIAVPGLPNFFMLNGPNGPVGNFSLIEVAELQLAYILQLVEQIRSGACREIGVSAEAAARFDAERREAAKSTIWATGCKSWYLDRNGLPTAWPFTFDRFREEMETPRLEDYEQR
ncbi:MAG TPA: NAD(P)/FAD-dependent oxidoreductase, partial [Acidimicrobiia bacterium]|nr:NAD(P)/FAD-dependent oxidoreductase [Acidimicrobiia bacterium]